MKPVIVFSVAAIPDVAGLRALYRLPQVLSDFEVGEYALQRQRANGMQALPLHLQRITAVSCAIRGSDGFRVRTLGDGTLGEADVLRAFSTLLATHVSSSSVSWQGGSTALPLLRLRALIHGVVMPAELFAAHCDLAIALHGRPVSPDVPLSELAHLSGLPGTEERDADDLWTLSQNGSGEVISAYADARALTTYLLHLRWLMTQGELDGDAFGAECRIVRATLESEAPDRWAPLLASWPTA